MIKIALLFVLIAGSVRAQVIAPTSGAQAWSGPIAGAVAAAGMDRISELGTLSLPRLAMPDAGGTIPMIKSPGLLNPMVVALAEAGHSPEAFAVLPTVKKLEVLAAAAKSAEASAAKNVAALAESARVVKAKSASELSQAAQQARALSVYLDGPAEESLAATEKAISIWQVARDEAVRAFLEDLPKKMAAGEFDGKTMLVKDESEGAPVWRLADGAPDETYATPQEALAARVAAAEAMPAGPWSAAEAALVADSVKAALESGLITDAAWGTDAARRLAAAKERGAAASAAGKLGKAAADYAKTGRLDGAQITAIEKYYEAGMESRVGGPVDGIRLRARALATIYAGGSGLPGWDTLQAAKRAFAARMNRTALWAGGVWVAALIPLIIASSFDAFKAFGGWGSFAFFLLMMSPIAVFATAIWKRDSHTGWSMSYVSELMRRTF